MAQVTPLPTPPTRSDPATFDARADAFLAALPAFGNECNAVIAQINAGTPSLDEGITTKDLSSGNVTLSEAETFNQVIKLTGTLAANRTVTVHDASIRDWIIINATSGAYTVTVKTPSGTGVEIVQGQKAVVACDGTNIVGILIGATGLIPTTLLDEAFHGQCRLSKSGANLVLLPHNGNKILINGVPQAIPAAGVSLAPSGLTQDTTYYIYAYLNSGTMTLEASATSHTTDTGTGVEIKSGAATHTLVGMARCVTGPAWSDNEAFVLSWFNRRPRVIQKVFTSDRTTGSTTPAELDSGTRAEFLVWSDDGVTIAATGASSVNNGDQYSITFIGIDGTSPEDSYTVSYSYGSGVLGGFCLSHFKTGLSEGYHYATLLGRVSANTGNWSGGGVNTERCSIKVSTGG
jgi:hypothetical protein